MNILLSDFEPAKELNALIELGLNHEQQHQELLLTDIKYILGHNPLFPCYTNNNLTENPEYFKEGFIKLPEGLYDIGHSGESFCFDNELGNHKVFLPEYSISTSLVTNSEYLEFINAGGYHDFKYWHSEGWDWVKNNQIEAPLYWYKIDNLWRSYTLDGLSPIKPDSPVSHISFYEATAYAQWKGMRLATEFEWEAAARQFKWGDRWEWTQSAYLPYPGFRKADGAIGEYNGKFMVNQMVLRGASEFTSPGHSRITYRNFFHPHLRWQLTGIRLAK
jgi:ergothioneine biosynthesis protein EgtB